MLEVLDPKMGRLCLRLWCNLHFQQSAKINMHVLQVKRLDAALMRTPPPLWLVWVGEGMPELSQIWRQYLRRFAIDHWYRFAIASLHWTLPKLGTREQCERWSDLMPLLTWQLWLARELVNDCPLPWQKSVTNLSPGRVAQSMGGKSRRLAHQPNLLNLVESLQDGLSDNHAAVKTVALLSKKVRLDKRNTSQSRLDSLTFIFCSM